MYTTFQQTFVYIHFVYKIKRTILAKFCTQNVYKSLLKCGIHFVYNHFVYILHIRVCPNVVYILHKNILYTKSIQSFVEMWDTIVCKNITNCIHFIKSVHLKHYVYNFYTKLYAYIIVYIIVCRMDPLFQHILTRLLCTF